MILAHLNLARLRNCLSLIVLCALVAVSNRFAVFPADAGSSLLIPASRQDQDDDVIRVNAELVILNATVLDKDGRFVSGLHRTDFRVFDSVRRGDSAGHFRQHGKPFDAGTLGGDSLPRRIAR